MFALSVFMFFVVHVDQVFGDGGVVPLSLYLYNLYLNDDKCYIAFIWQLRVNRFSKHGYRTKIHRKYFIIILLLNVLALRLGCIPQKIKTVIQKIIKAAILIAKRISEERISSRDYIFCNC